ncbi:MAG: hypothetical protein M2R45_01706 [Verrucomicrobia subdivision 3 bacterium]|nr:hypothetical protein [Limisphaerales bacterium]MCS1413445.1 hypothetical protein [Limisphaerales bacterium]
MIYFYVALIAIGVWGVIFEAWKQTDEPAPPSKKTVRDAKSDAWTTHTSLQWDIVQPEPPDTVQPEPEQKPEPKTYPRTPRPRQGIWPTQKYPPQRKENPPLHWPPSLPEKRIVPKPAPVIEPEKRIVPLPEKQKINGRAYVIDGDTIGLNGQRIRLAGIDAPELAQQAQRRNGQWFDAGELVKACLIKKIGYRWITVTVEKEDKYGRLVGRVTCNSKDIGAWLVRNGYAVASYDNRYDAQEHLARKGNLGM